jgi:hypothetical protein
VLSIVCYSLSYLNKILKFIFTDFLRYRRVSKFKASIVLYCNPKYYYSISLTTANVPKVSKLKKEKT